MSEIGSSQVVSLTDSDDIKFYIDFAFSPVTGSLVLIGWLYDPQNKVRGFSLLHDKTKIIKGREKKYDVTSLTESHDGLRLSRISRLDVASALSVTESVQKPFGFVLYLPLVPAGAEVALELSSNKYVIVQYKKCANNEAVIEGLKNYWIHSGDAVLNMLESVLDKGQPLLDACYDLNVRMLPQRISKLTTTVNDKECAVISVDHVISLGAGGLLVFGWKHYFKAEPKSITVYESNGSAVDVTSALSTVIREDVWQNLRNDMHGMMKECGYVIAVPIPHNPGTEYAIRFAFDGGKDFYLKVRPEEMTVSGVELTKRILAMLHQPQAILYKLNTLFDRGLGAGIEHLSQQQQQQDLVIDIKQYGEPVSSPAVTVVVPLYGRFDFVRHQLAQFADDPDFSNVDLIYVMDDPNIYHQTRQLVTKYQSLFGISLRLVSYAKNLGFAGASNVGAKVAKGDYVVMLNSDIIPQHNGWLSIMKTALDTLPDAGAVGPLLQFYDDSIQHAGMYPKRSPALPGFLLNTHRKMGMAWDGDTSPYETPMLTAACLMMRKSEFDQVGGFDEGYIVGDFEDSDLCLALRKLGKKMWLVPAAQLWHLERQSQKLSSEVGQRQLITLFNGWRYMKKIERGELVDPTSLEVSA